VLQGLPVSLDPYAPERLEIRHLCRSQNGRVTPSMSLVAQWSCGVEAPLHAPVGLPR
jgi:hypothetical protein